MFIQKEKPHKKTISFNPHHIPFLILFQFWFGLQVFFHMPIDPPLWSLGILVFFGMITIRLIPRWGNIIILPFLISFSYLSIYTELKTSPFLDTSLAWAHVQGKVIDIDRGTPTKLVIDIHKTSELTLENKRVKVKTFHDSDVKSGDIVQFNGRFYPPQKINAPYDFDGERWAFFHNIQAYGTVLGDITIVKSAPQNTYHWIHDFRLYLTNKLNIHLSKENLSIAKALIIGERDMPDEQTKILRYSGLAHLLAISGLHLGLMSLLVFQFIRLICAFFPSATCYYPTKSIAAFFALLSCLFYFLISGMNLPTQRAFIMIAFCLIGIMLNRSHIMPRLITIAGLFILCLDPIAAITPGFQLSFTAVIILVASLSQPKSHHLESSAIWQFMKTTALLTLFLSPIALYHFQYAAQLGAIANFLAIPFMTFWLMPMIILTFLTLPFGFEFLPLWGLNFGIDLLMTLAHYCAHIPFSVFHIGLMSWFSFIGYFLFLFFLLFMPIRKYIKFIMIIVWFGQYGLPKSVPYDYISTNQKQSYFHSKNTVYWSHSADKLEDSKLNHFHKKSLKKVDYDFPEYITIGQSKLRRLKRNLLKRTPRCKNADLVLMPKVIYYCGNNPHLENYEHGYTISTQAEKLQIKPIQPYKRKWHR